MKRSKVKQQRRHYLLLEVMIAFFLLVLCALPLFYPHGYMLKEEKLFVQDIELSRSIDLVYSTVLEKLYRNQIAWQDIEDEIWHDLDESFFVHDPKLFSHLAYRGKYQISSSKDKKEKKEQIQTNNRHHLININLTFVPKNSKEKTQTFIYKAVVTQKEQTPSSEK